jgi:hypothetical protein
MDVTISATVAERLTGAIPNAPLVLLLLALGAGCNRGSEQTQAKGDSGATRVHSKAELDKLIIPGTDVTDVIRTFGRPASETQIKEGTSVLMYTFPFEVASRPPEHIIGFDVHTRDGKVVGWSPILGESGEMLSEVSQEAIGERRLEIFLVRDSLRDVLQVFKSEGTASTMNVKGSPDLAFKAQVFVGRSGGDGSGKTPVRLVLAANDVSNLKTFTETNLGERVLLVCRNYVIDAPVLTEAIPSQQLVFTVEGARSVDILKQK